MNIKVLLNLRDLGIDVDGEQGLVETLTWNHKELNNGNLVITLDDSELDRLKEDIELIKIQVDIINSKLDDEYECESTVLGIDKHLDQQEWIKSRQ